MALPTLMKTWQFNVNNLITAGAADTALTGSQKTLWGLKNALVTMPLNPWTVVRSSDGVTAANSDLWTDSTKLIWNNNGSNHSWIVLKQTGVASNYQIAFDCNNVASNNLSVWVSPSAGFTGGTITTLPGAADSTVLSNNTSWNGPGSLGVNCAFHVLQTTDGSITRMVVMNAGFMVSYWSFEKPVAAVTGWTTPTASTMLGQGNLVTNTATYANYNDLSRVSCRLPGGVTNAYLTAEGAVNNSAGEIVNNFPNETSMAFPLYPVGLFTNTTVGVRGRIGACADLYWTSQSNLAQGTTFPASGTKLWVLFGHLVFPWNGTTPVIS